MNINDYCYSALELHLYRSARSAVEPDSLSKPRYGFLNTFHSQQLYDRRLIYIDFHLSRLNETDF